MTRENVLKRHQEVAIPRSKFFPRARGVFLGNIADYAENSVQSMRTITRQTNVIAILAVFFSVCVPNSASAAKDVFIRTKPHVNVGTIGGEPAEIWFHANAGVFEDGNASGIIEARVIGGESFLYRAVEGEAIIERGTVVELTLTLERVGEDGTPTGETDQVIVRHSPTREDCLIYDLVGPNIHVEPEGILDFTHNNRRP
jgi:hypothetical protein